VFGSILQRAILWELIKVFVLSLVGITGILLMAGIIAEASQRGLSPAQILAVIPLLIPSTLPYTIPATTLFATCLVYGRLAHDNEIIAIKAAGVNVLNVVWPGVFMGLLMSGMTMGLYYRIIPYTHHLMRSMFLNDVEELLYAMLRKDHFINHPKLGYGIWVRQVQGRRLIDPVFKRRGPKGDWDIVARAMEAELRVDVPNGQVLVHMVNGEFYSEGSTARATFDDRIWPVPLPPSPFGANGPPKPRDMSWQEMLRCRREILDFEDKMTAEIELAMSRLMLNNAAPDLPKHVNNLRVMKHQVHQELNSLDTELYMRPALSFGCLCFVLVGCPVGIWFSRSDYLSAFSTCFLPIVFLYYPLLLCGTNLAKDGKIHAAAALWSANAVMAMIAVLLFRRLLKN
jgi:lipopolysaccharide export system permease protein